MEVVAAEGTTIVKSATIATAPAETKAASEVSETTAVVAEAVSVTVSASMSAMIATTVDREMKRAEVGPIANAAMEMNAARQERINMPRHRWAEHRRCSLLSLHRLMIAATAAVGAEADPRLLDRMTEEVRPEQLSGRGRNTEAVVILPAEDVVVEEETSAGTNAVQGTAGTQEVMSARGEVMMCSMEKARGAGAEGRVFHFRHHYRPFPPRIS